MRGCCDWTTSLVRCRLRSRPRDRPGGCTSCWSQERLPSVWRPTAIRFAQQYLTCVRTGIAWTRWSWGGRSGTEHNARQIAEHFEKHPERGDLPLVLIGYSKGTNDILGFLDHYPTLARSVGAVVSIAGPVAGSPIANGTSGLYGLFSHLPTPDCPVGDGEVVRSLRTEVRREWMARARLPETVRYYSIVAIATRARVARTLAPAWRFLLRHDRRNDGQVLARDALLPHSTVLGYLQADHWEVALDLEEHRAFAVHREDARPFPRLALLRAIGRQIGDDLGPSARAGHSAVP